LKAVSWSCIAFFEFFVIGKKSTEVAGSIFRRREVNYTSLLLGELVKNCLARVV